MLKGKTTFSLTKMEQSLMSNLHTFTNKILFQELAKNTEHQYSVVLNSVRKFYVYLIVIIIKCTVHMPGLHASVL